MIGLTKKSKDKKKTKQQEIEEESSEEESKQMTLVDLLGGGPADAGPEGRSIMFVGDVTEDKAADLISALLVLAQTKDEEDERAEDIKLYISTYGGSADEMFGIYDVMNFASNFVIFKQLASARLCQLERSCWRLVPKARDTLETTQES